MEKATLSPFNNRWSRVHDFTPAAADEDNAKHFVLKSKNLLDDKCWAILEDFLFAPLKSQFPIIISCDPEKSVVPLTMFENQQQQQRRRSETRCLILLFQQPGRTIFQRNGDILSLLHHLRQKDCHLVSSSESTMNEIHVERMTDGKNFNKNLEFGSVVGLQLSGLDCSIVCRNLLETLQNEIGPFFVTDEKNYREKFKIYSGFVEALNNV